MRPVQFETAYFLGVSGIFGGCEGCRVLRRVVPSDCTGVGSAFTAAALVLLAFGVFACGTAFDFAAGFTSEVRADFFALVALRGAGALAGLGADFGAGLVAVGFGAGVAFTAAGLTATVFATAFGAAGVAATLLAFGFATGFAASLTTATFGFGAALRGAVFLATGEGLLARWLEKSGEVTGAAVLAGVVGAEKGAHIAWLITMLTRSCCSTVFPKNCHPATVALTGSTSKFIWFVLYFPKAAACFVIQFRSIHVPQSQLGLQSNVATSERSTLICSKSTKPT
ncbi:MAG: hypothetical protein JXQ85_15170 [Cognatishimia sp.]|uniref:hypothetical protein n=1 Tax=Cognatishimia sp. TaxID=2211648 RepID=UPI003B8AC984